jgi:hypothetical protein
MSARSTNNYTDDFENNTSFQNEQSKSNHIIISRKNRGYKHDDSFNSVSTLPDQKNSTRKEGLTSDELKRKLVQVVKNKGIYDIMKVRV